MRHRAWSARGLGLATGLSSLMFAAQAAVSDPKQIALGRHLAGECSACHRLDGTDNGIPSITGRDPQEFITTLNFYRNGERGNPAMISVAESLNDEQVAALAAYFGTLPKGGKNKR